MLYIASVIHIPQWAILEYNKIIRDFVWNNKPSKIKYTTLIAPIAQGGLQLQDLQTKIDANKITWIKNMDKNLDKKHLQYKNSNSMEGISTVKSSRPHTRNSIIQ